MQRINSSVFLLRRTLHRFVFHSWIKTVAIGTVSIAIPQKCSDEPDEQGEWHDNSHDHAAQFITEVHKNTDNVKCFGQRKDNNDAFYKKHDGRGKATVKKIHCEAQCQFNNGNDQKQPECFPDTACSLRRLVVIRYFRRLCMMFHLLIQLKDLDKIKTQEYEYPDKVYKVPVQTSFFNHQVMATSFKNII